MSLIPLSERARRRAPAIIAGVLAAACLVAVPVAVSAPGGNGNGNANGLQNNPNVNANGNGGNGNNGGGPTNPKPPPPGQGDCKNSNGGNHNGYVCGGGGGGEGGGENPGSGPVVNVTPTTTTTQEAPSAVQQQAAQLAGCASRRGFRIRIRKFTADPVIRAQVFVEGRRVAVRRSGGRLTAFIALHGKPKRTVRVHILARTRSGRLLRGNRVYHPCTAKRPHTVPPL